MKLYLASLSEAYKKDIIVVETGYDIWGGDQKQLPHPLTPAGQKTFMDELMGIVAATPGGRDGGVFYWAPEWIMGKKWNAPDWSGQWEDRAWFDASGNMRPVMESFHSPVQGK